jgi:hypothetical protein
VTTLTTTLADELEACYDAYDAQERESGRLREQARALRRELAFSRGFSYPPAWTEGEASAADLAAFADAVADYASTYAAEEQGSEADKSWRRQTLLLEGAELFRRAGLELAA